jgi:type IV secretion system protein VirB4
MSKWLGAAAWNAKEAQAGDRLPYATLVDSDVVLLRDGSLMAALQVPGLLFETEDTQALNAHAATREVMLRSNLDGRFVLYHHVIRRRVSVELDAQFDDPLSAHIDARWRQRLAAGSLFVNDQFVTLVRRPARGKAGWGERLGKMFKGQMRFGPSEAEEVDTRDLRTLRAALQALAASLGDYGAQALGDYTGPSGHVNN